MQRTRTIPQLGLLGLLVLLLLVAAGLRLHQLGAQSLWYDEGVSYGYTQRSLAELIPALGQDVHPPAYALLLSAYAQLTGTTEFALRSLSVWASLISIALLYALGRRLYGPVAGLAAASFGSLNSFSIYYAQEARMYALLGAIACASMLLCLLFWRAAGPKRWRWGLALACVNALGLYTQYSYALILIAQGLLALAWLLADLRARRWQIALRGLGQFTLLNLLTLGLYAPWLGIALTQVSSQPNISEAIPLTELLRTIQGWLAIGISYESSLGSMGVIVYFVLLFGLISLPNQGQRSGWRLLIPVLWVLVAVGGYLYLELYTRYLRFLLPAQLGLMLWLGRGIWVLWHLRPRNADGPLRGVPRLASVVAWVFFMGTLAGSLPALYEAEAYQRDDYRGLAQRLEAEASAEDAIILSGPGLQEIFGYYYDGPASIYPLPQDPAQISADTAAVIAAHRQSFAVLYGATEQDPSRQIERSLNSEAFPLSDSWVDSMRLLEVLHSDAPLPLEPLDLRFGEDIRLTALGLNTASAQAGEALLLDLRWTTDAPLDRPYKIFVQLLNPDGSLAAQRDSEAFGGLAPTQTWQPGEIVIDHHALRIPAEAAPGNYTLILGWYDANNPFSRLQVGQGDYYEVATIRVD